MLFVVVLMDRSWMIASRLSREYANGVEQFLDWGKSYAIDRNGRFRCPCNKCLNMVRLKPDKIKEHLYLNGILRSYKKWTLHGELLGRVHVPEGVEEVEVDTNDHIEEMIRNLGFEPFQ